MPQLLGIAIVWFSLISAALAQTEIEPSKGLEHLGEKVQVTFTVASMGGAGDNFELDSRESWKEPDCFMVHLTPAVQTALKEKDVKDLVKHFARKKIVVTGTVREINPGGMKRASILVSSLADIRTVEATADPKPATDVKFTDIEPSKALDYVGKAVRVRMFVTSIGGAGDSQVLNSAKEWNAPGNLSILLPPDILEAYRKEGIEKPNLHFWNKTVEVTGIVREVFPGGMKVPEIKIESRDDLRIVLVSTRQAPEITDLLNRRVDLQLKNDQFLINVQVTLIETRGDPVGILNLKVRSGNVAPKPFAAAAVEEIFVDDMPLDLTYDRKSRLLIVDNDQRAARLKKSEEIERRVFKRGGKFWEYLSPDEQTERVAKGKEFLTSVQKQFPQSPLKVVETKYYLLITDLDPASAQQYLKYLDSLYDEMCRAFAIPLGKNLWAGKCIVATFQKQADFLQFEKESMKNNFDSTKAQGLCHAQTDGQVVISAWKGDLTTHFASALVHETSHGFVARYRSDLRAPSWLNEGMADWIANRIVKNDNLVARQTKSGQLIQQQRTLDGFFEAAQISGDQYGAASSMVSILLEIDPNKFRRFFIGIKEGLSEEDSLQQEFQMTHRDLARLYGRRIGVPDLTP
ncbi:MAG: hypothetical protein NT013_17095 [Planctomycetia bacterium]|nr:hypothetical protein [Planctomycetia bacterium]